jgi:hypothetical protein
LSVTAPELAKEDKKQLFLMQILQWLVVFLVPPLPMLSQYGSGTLLLPLGATAGVWVGLTSTHPYCTIGFKLGLALALIPCVVIFALGLRRRRALLGKFMTAATVYGWCILGLIGFGPQ